jgi:hypothetical protein
MILIALAAVQLSGAGWVWCHADPREIETCRAAHVSPRTTPDQAEPFLGEWTSLVEGPAGPTNFIIEIKVDKGKALATVRSDLMGENRVENITTTGKGIALRYTSEWWGYSVPVVLTLVRDGDQLQADFSIMSGWFKFGGGATKKG